MITKHSVIVIGVAIIISVLILIFGGPKKKYPEKSEKLSYNTFYIKSGWGYDIIMNNRTIIHQELIPALTVQRGFEKKEDAEKAAQLVIQKIKNRQSPALSKNEIFKFCFADSLNYGHSESR